MELIIINDKKMKIMLSEKELNRYNIDSENFSMNNDAQRHAFRRVLNDACKQSGFEGRASRLMVQMYPVKKGGCEIFVTRIENCEEDKKALPLSPISLDIECCDITDDIACYAFGSFTHINTVCKQLLVSGFSGKSNAYISNDGTYYLILCSFSSKESFYKPYNSISFINEFAKSTGVGTLSYAEDYCKKICDQNAVEILGNI